MTDDKKTPKPTRKRKQVEFTTAGTSYEKQLERAFGSLKKAAGKDALRNDRREAECRKAIGVEFDVLILEKSERERAEAFARMEASATAANRKKIAWHPLRPAMTDALVEKLIAEAEAVQEAEANATNKDGDKA